MTLWDSAEKVKPEEYREMMKIKCNRLKSGLIGNTAPSYEAYIQLKKDIINKVEAIVPSPVRP